MARICVLTAGHLSTCPRMVKAADALAAAGHDIRVISTRQTPWAVAADEDMRKTRHWSWRVVDYRADQSRMTYLKAGVRGRLAHAAVGGLGAARVPLGVAIQAYARAHSELVAAALEERVDLFYGGTTGALAATAQAAAQAGTPYGLDLEDFHSEEQQGADGPMMNLLADRILRSVLPGAAFVTASSGPMSAEFQNRYGVRTATVHNTFPLPARPPAFHHDAGAPMKAYWFSQTIGEGRGLEGFIRAAGIAEVPIELHLRGRASGGYVEALTALARSCAPGVSVIAHLPGSPEAMVAMCEGYDIGLALEQNVTLSRRLSLTNKSLTYILGGLAVVLTDTEGQRELAADLGEGALMYREGDDQALAAGLRRWSTDPAQLLAARRSAWAAAARKWHWEHASQQGTLLAVVESALSRRSGAEESRGEIAAGVEARA